MRRIEVGEIISRHDYVSLREEDHGVAVGVAVLKMDYLNLSAIHVQSQLIGKSDPREGERQIRNSRIVRGGHPLSHIVLANEDRRFPEIRIAARVVAMPMSVQHIFDRLVRDGL